jgi:hypothetical protein
MFLRVTSDHEVDILVTADILSSVPDNTINFLQ